MNGALSGDNNFMESEFAEEGISFYDVRCGRFQISGFPYLEENEGEFLRLPKRMFDRIPENLQELARVNSGGCIRFMTNSKRIAVKTDLSSDWDLSIMTRSGMMGIDIYIGANRDKRFVKNISCLLGAKNLTGVADISDQGGTYSEVTVYFPLYHQLKNFYIGLDDGCEPFFPVERSFEKPILFYGSSITQGGCTDRPGNAYFNLLSRWLDANIIGMGFAGNAKGEPVIAELIGDLDISMMVYDYDHNAPTPMHLQATHYPFYEIVRKHHPEIPIIMVTRPDASYDEHQVNKKIIFHSYQKAKANGDENVYFVDGSRLFGDWGRDECTVDNCHPNALGSFRMAEGLYPLMAEILGVEDRLF